MKKYLQTILLFDVALPALAIGLPCCVLFWAVLHSENVASEKALQRAAFDDRAFPIGDRMLIEPRVVQVPVDGREIRKAEFVRAVRAVPQTCFLHDDLQRLRPPPVSTGPLRTADDGPHISITPAGRARDL